MKSNRHAVRCVKRKRLLYPLGETKCAAFHRHWPSAARVHEPDIQSTRPGGRVTQRGGDHTKALPVQSQWPGSSVSGTAETGGLSSGSIAPRAGGTAGHAGGGGSGGTGAAQLARRAAAGAHAVIPASRIIAPIPWCRLRIQQRPCRPRSPARGDHGRQENLSPREPQSRRPPRWDSDRPHRKSPGTR